MLKIKVENGIPMKTSLYFIDLQLVFKKTVSFAMTLTKLLTLFTKETMIFQEKVV